MAIIHMTGGFKICPEGKHVFKISKVDYEPDFGKLVVHMVTKEGYKHTERFSLMDARGEMNDKACNAFSFFAKTALNNFTVEEIDHNDLVNHYIGGMIVHTESPSRKDPASTVTFANITEKWVATGFDEAPDAQTGSVDLNSLLD